MGLKDVFRDVVTTKDGRTHDLGRWSWVLSFGAVVSAAGANWFHGQVIGVRELAEALGIVAAAHGAALWAKADTEPEPPEEPKS